MTTSSSIKVKALLKKIPEEEIGFFMRRVEFYWNKDAPSANTGKEASEGKVTFDLLPVEKQKTVNTPMLTVFED